FGGSPAPDVQSAYSGTAHDALFSIAFAGDKGYAVGTAGELVQSNDAGKNWTLVKTPTSLALLGVAACAGHTIVVGQEGVIVIGAGNGQWTKAPSGTTNRLFSVSVNPAGYAVAVGAFGTILKSQDGGQTWSSIAPDWTSYTPDGAQPHLYAVAVDDKNVITLAGEFGLILRSSDGGASWKVLHKDEASLFAMDIRPDGTGFAVGQSGTVLKTMDSGATWSAVKVDGNANLLGVSSGANGHTVITGMHDMLISDDDGTSFRHVDDAATTAAWYQGIARSGPDAPAYAVGHSGQIIRIRG
ncbi:MAG TPA: photosystem I reaction center subunit IX, partial [Stenotrophobium sp.]|nr:photosystem I reaction center subunit IX [Stenotrophobium sp.]